MQVENCAVDLDRGTTRVLEEEDRAVEVKLPRRTDREDEVEKAAATGRPLAFPPAMETTVSRSLSSGTGPVVSPPSTLRKRSVVNSEGDGLPTIVRLEP